MTILSTHNKSSTVSTKKGRNGLIDLYRFLLALVVVKSHGLFVISSPYFGPGCVCVEFFFVLSGFLFMSFLQKSKDQPIKESLLKLYKSRVLPLAIPLVIGLVSNIICNLITKEFNLWGYLWYIKVMLVEMMGLIFLRKRIKNDRTFTLTIVIIMVIALVLKFSGLLYSFGYARGASSIPAGMLIAMLPKWKPRNKWIILLPLIPVFLSCFSIVCFNLGDVEWLGIRIPELILDNILYPALIYLSFCLEFKCKFFSYLGALSFGLYAFQCPADLLRTLGIKSVWVLFVFIVLATVLEDGGKRFIKHIRNKHNIT